MSSDVGSPAWYAVQFGSQKSYREMLCGTLDLGEAREQWAEEWAEYRLAGF